MRFLSNLVAFLREHMTSADIVILAVVLLLALTASFAMTQLGGRDQQPDLVQVRHLSSTAPQEISLRVELPDEDEYVVEGTIGVLVLEIDGHRARLVDADCPRQICVRTGWLTRPGDRAICVPNEVVVELIGEDEGLDVDEIIR